MEVYCHECAKTHSFSETLYLTDEDKEKLTKRKNEVYPNAAPPAFGWLQRELDAKAENYLHHRKCWDKTADSEKKKRAPWLFGEHPTDKKKAEIDAMPLEEIQMWIDCRRDDCQCRQCWVEFVCQQYEK